MPGYKKPLITVIKISVTTKNTLIQNVKQKQNLIFNMIPKSSNVSELMSRRSLRL